MKKLYIVISSLDEHSDHYKVNECVCSSLFFAENKKTEIENKYREEILFPFDWCTNKDFHSLLGEGNFKFEDLKEIFKLLRKYK